MRLRPGSDLKSGSYRRSIGLILIFGIFLALTAAACGGDPELLAIENRTEGPLSVEITEVPDEPLGRGDEPRHADAVALGEADHTWPRLVEDAARGQLQEVYLPVDESGTEVKPDLTDYPRIPWDTIDLRDDKPQPTAAFSVSF